MSIPFITLANTGVSVPYLIPVFPQLPQGWSIRKSPLWPARTMRSVSGLEWRATDQIYPRYEWELVYPLLRDGSYDKNLGGTGDGFDEFHDLAGFFDLLAGGYSTFLYDDPTDDSVVAQAIGIGNGSRTVYQMQRTLGAGLPGGGWTDPVYAINAVANVFLDGSATTNYLVDNLTGLLTFANPPGNSAHITATFTYYWYVRFVQDQMNFENFMVQLWQNKSVKFKNIITGPSPTAPTPSPDGIAIGQALGPFSVATSGLTTTKANDVIVVWVVMEQTADVTQPPGLAVPIVNTLTSTHLTFTRRFRYSSTTMPVPTHQPAAIAVEEWWAPASGTLSGEIITATFTGGIAAACITAVAINGPSTSVPFDSNPALPAINTANMSGTTAAPSVSGVSTNSPGTLVLLMSAGWSAVNSGTLVCVQHLGVQFPGGGGTGFTSAANAFDNIEDDSYISYTLEPAALHNRSYVCNNPNKTAWSLVVADALVHA